MSPRVTDAKGCAKFRGLMQGDSVHRLGAKRPSPGAGSIVCRAARFSGRKFVVCGTLDHYACYRKVDNVVAMSEAFQPVTILSETECWNLLSSASLGRLVTSVDGEPDIFPVNFVVQHRTVLLRTAEGTKLVSAAINNNVLFEADEHNVAEGWSVIVKGMARLLRTDERDRRGGAGRATPVDGDGEATLRSNSPAERHRPAILFWLRARPRLHRCVRSPRPRPALT